MVEYSCGDRVVIVTGYSAGIEGYPRGVVSFSHSVEGNTFYDVSLDRGTEIVYNKTVFDLKPEKEYDTSIGNI